MRAEPGLGPVSCSPPSSPRWPSALPVCGSCPCHQPREGGRRSEDSTTLVQPAPPPQSKQTGTHSSRSERVPLTRADPQGHAARRMAIPKERD